MSHNTKCYACGRSPTLEHRLGEAGELYAIACCERDDWKKRALDAESDHERTLEKWRQTEVELDGATQCIQELGNRLAELERIVNPKKDEFAYIEEDRDDLDAYICWYECCKCGEPMEDTTDLSDDQANGNTFKCRCGQKYIGVTHIMLHALKEEELSDV